MHANPVPSACRSLLWITLLAAPLQAADPPAPAVPTVPAPGPPPAVPAVAPGGVLTPLKTLALEVTVIRYKPDSKERILQDFAFAHGASNVVEQLRGSSRSVDVVYRGTREVVLEDKAEAVFDATETRPVVLVGQPGAPVPPATLYGLKLKVSVRPGTNAHFALFWEGGLTWSPELMDRRAGIQNTMQFIGKASAAAQQASQFAGDAKGTVNQAADIGLTLAQLFAPDKAGNSSIYELPVVKTLGLTGSRYCASGETAVTLTAAEIGAKEPQTIIMLIDPLLRE